LNTYFLHPFDTYNDYGHPNAQPLALPFIAFGHQRGPNAFQHYAKMEEGIGHGLDIGRAIEDGDHPNWGQQMARIPIVEEEQNHLNKWKKVISQLINLIYQIS
jgi:hypothetical protein